MPTVKTRFEISGEKEYRAAISEINSGQKVLNAEMNKTKAVYAENAESMDALSAKHDVLERQISSQRDKVDKLREALQHSATTTGESSKNTMKWQESLYNAEAALAKMENELQDTDDQMEELNNSSGKSGKSLEDISKTLESKLPSGARNAISSLGQLDAKTLILVGSLAALASAIVAVEKGLIDMTKASAAVADELITLSAQTGVSTQELQEFKYASDLIDVSMDTLHGSLTKITSQMSAAQEEGSAAAQAFQALGVAISDENGWRSAQDVFMDTIDALGQIENATERDAMAMQLLGKSATDLNPLIMQGSEALREYADEAHNAGYVMTDEELAALGAVDDAFQRLQLQQEATKNSLSAEFAPYLAEFYDDVTGGIKTTGNALKQSGIVESFGMLLETAGDIINPMDKLSNDKVPALTMALRPLAQLIAAIADAGNFISGLLTLDFNKVGTAMGLNYNKGQASNQQKLWKSWEQQDTNRATIANGYGSYYDATSGQYYGSLNSYAAAEYDRLVAAGDSSVLGMSSDVWMDQYIKKLRGNAAGTNNWSGGFTMVGENGPEVAWLPRGSQIATAQQTRSMGGDTFYITIDAKSVKEFNDIIDMARNQQRFDRMGVKR